MIFLLQVLATYRIARLIAVDNGPFDIFLFIRQELGKRANSNRVMRTLADGANCQFCVGFWVALMLALLFQEKYPWWLSWLAIAGGQAFFVDLVYKDE